MVMGMLGGLLIGLSAVWLYLSLGRVAGISGQSTESAHAAEEIQCARPCSTPSAWLREVQRTSPGEIQRAWPQKSMAP